MKSYKLKFIYLLLLFLSCNDAEKKLQFLNPDGSAPSAPKVLFSNPSPSQRGVDKKAKIEVTFNKEVSRESCLGAFSLQPAVSGIFDFAGPLMQFTPDKPLENGETYVLSISRQCEDTDGRDLEATYYASFTVGENTTPPQVKTVYGFRNSTGCENSSELQVMTDFDQKIYNTTDYCISTPIVVQFSEAMDRSSVEQSFTVSPGLVGSFQWNGDDSRFTYYPKDPLSNGITYVGVIAVTAKDSVGNSMTDSQSFSFTVGEEADRPEILMQDGYLGNPDCSEANATYASIIDTSDGLRNQTGVCSSAVEGQVNSPIIIDFSEDMEKGRTESSFSVSPGMNGVKTWSLSPLCGTTEGSCDQNASRMTFTPIDAWTPSSTYTVSISPSAEDTSGNTLAQDYSFSFTVGYDWDKPRVVMQDGLVGDGDCTFGNAVYASTLDPVNGLRNQTGVCTGAVPGNENTDIIIDFSEDVDAASAEAAFSVSPSLDGFKTWDTSPYCGITTGSCTASTSRLTFTPIEFWKNATTYTVSISQNVKDLSANNMATNNSFSFTIGEDFDLPTVISVNADQFPSCDRDAESQLVNLMKDICHKSSDLLFTVLFSEEMDPSVTMGSFQISPSIDGSLSWNPAYTELSFIPSEDLKLFEQYKVTVTTSARDAAGNYMATPTVLYITTGDGTPDPDITPPEITDILSNVESVACDGTAVDSIFSGFVTDVCTDNGHTGKGAIFEVFFNKDMDPETTAAAFSLSPNVDGKVIVIANYIRFIAEEALDPDTQYELSVSSSATDYTGRNMKESQTLFFTTTATGGYPAVDGIEIITGPHPCNTGSAANIVGTDIQNACVDDNYVTIAFSESMDTSSVESSFSISPSVTGKFVWSTVVSPNDTLTYTFDESLDPGTRYTVKIASGAKDAQGHELQEKVTGDFVVGALDSTPPRVDHVAFEIPDVDKETYDSCGATPDDIFVTLTGTNVSEPVCRATAIQIVFSEAMDQASVISAVSVDGDSGDLKWNWANSATLNIYNASGKFKNGTLLTLSITDSASDLMGNTLEEDFLVTFTTENTSPRVRAIGLASQIAITSPPEDAGPGCTMFDAIGGNYGYGAGNCWWDESLVKQAAYYYKFYGENRGCGIGGATDTAGRKDNIRLIFSKKMNPNIAESITLRKISSPSDVISLANYDWSDSYRVLTLAFAAQSATGCDTEPEEGPVANEFNLGRTREVGTDPVFPDHYPLYSIEVPQGLEADDGEVTQDTFIFSFEGD